MLTAGDVIKAMEDVGKITETEEDMTLEEKGFAMAGVLALGGRLLVISGALSGDEITQMVREELGLKLRTK